MTDLDNFIKVYKNIKIRNKHNAITIIKFWRNIL